MAIAAPSAAFAQIVPGDIPRTAEPSRADPEPRSLPEARAVPAGPEPLVRAQNRPEAAADTQFVFRKLIIEGAEAIPEQTLRDLWTLKAGETASVGDLFAFADRVTRLYAQNDYFLSFALVPQQEIADGTVRIEVIEGYISSIRIVREGSTWEINSDTELEDEPLALRTAARILEARPLTAAELERALLLLNDLPGLSAKATVSPSPDTPKASLLTIDLTHRDVQASADYSSTMSSVLGRDIVGLSLSLSDDSNQVRLRGLASPDGRYYRALTGEITRWIGPRGLRVDGRLGLSHSRPIGELLETIRYRGSTLNLDLGLTVPLRRSRSSNLGITVGGHMANSDADVLDTVFTRDRLRTATIDLDFDWADAEGGINVLRAGVTKGFDALGATDDNDPLRTRAFGSASFLNFTLYAQRYQPVAQIADGDFGVLARGSGQWAATDALLSAAECTYGGAGFGRSYDSGIISADHCLIGGLEARWSRSLSASGADPIGLGLYGFVDGGVGRQKGRLEPGEKRKRSASSAGGGMSLQIGPRIAARLEAARGLSGPGGRDWRANASLSVSLR